MYRNGFLRMADLMLYIHVLNVNVKDAETPDTHTLACYTKN